MEKDEDGAIESHHNERNERYTLLNIKEGKKKRISRRLLIIRRKEKKHKKNTKKRFKKFVRLE